MEPDRQDIFVLWDYTSEARLALQALENTPAGARLRYADPDAVGDLLEDSLLPGLRSSERVLIIHPPDTELLSVALEAGIAIGLGKPVAVLELPNREWSLPYAINLLFDADLPERAITDDLAALADRLREPSFWHALGKTRPESSHVDRLALCSRDGIGAALLKLLKEARPDWTNLVPEDVPGDAAWLAAQAGQLLWVVIPGSAQRQWGNLVSALATGFFLGSAWARPDHLPRLDVLRHREAPRIRSIEPYCRTFDDLDDFRDLLLEEEEGERRPAAISIDKLTIRDFKNIRELELDFTAFSSLSGNWTCIAGINGSGKTAILQALSMVLLGPELVRDIGGQRLQQMLRRKDDEVLNAEIRVSFRQAGKERVLALQLSEEELGKGPLRDWKRLEHQIIVAYGASRNLSELRDDGYGHIRPQARRQITLFDPSARVASVEALLQQGSSAAPEIQTLRRILDQILGQELEPQQRELADRLIFRQSGCEVEAINLPDGFRSTVAWLADLCSTWHRVAPPEDTATSDPEKIQAIVLLDEIDLHLHPSLQRALVPRLRDALPNVQFIVTTHSPLILSSFDRNELILLDRNAEGGIRELDRQIFGFSADEIYDWLMGTRPQGTVIEQKLRDRNDPDLALYFYQSTERNEDEAKADLEERRRLIEENLGPKAR
ncbi:MAG TPA: AAA family ATPase [Thermoanaerobaculia bacterium]|nr:AAA family ATPase [Thermoanaerobaculia bacterium]